MNFTLCQIPAHWVHRNCVLVEPVVHGLSLRVDYRWYMGPFCVALAAGLSVRNGWAAAWTPAGLLDWALVPHGVEVHLGGSCSDGLCSQMEI